jgi:hypothetical protein
LIDPDDDLRRCGVVMRQVADDIVTGGGDGDVEELPHVSVEEIDRLVPPPCEAVVQRQAHVYDALLAEDLRRDAHDARLARRASRGEREYGGRNERVHESLD